MKALYTGVWQHKKTKMWHSKVTHKHIVYFCGKHNTPEAAAKARDKKIIEKGLPQALQILKPLPKK